MKKIYGAIIFLIFLQPASAQTNTLDWAKRIGGASSDEAFSVANDLQGNVYICGSFAGKVDFDPSPSSTYYMTSVNSSVDIFVFKLDATGKFIWAKSMGGDYDESALSIYVDASGACYMTGFFQDSADFDPSSNVRNLGAVGNDDLFICKLDRDGNYVWAQQIGNTGFDYGNYITGRNGYIYITGTYQTTVDFDPGSNVYNLKSVGEFDIHVAKFDTAGNFVWAKSMGGVTTESGYSLATDAYGNIYATGLYQDDVDFDPGPNSYILKSQGGTEIFISKLDSTGGFQWAKRIGGTSDDQGLSIVADDSGNTYSTGYYSLTVDFNPGVPKYNLTSLGAVDAYILKLDAKGNFVWAKSLSGSSAEVGNYLTSDQKGNIFVTGYFDGTVDFDPSSKTYSLTSKQNTDIYSAQYDTSGNFKWAYGLGGKNYDFGQGMSVDFQGDVYTIGYFADSANFSIDSTQKNIIVSAGNNDVFVHKIKRCQPTQSVLNISSCDSFLWQNNYIKQSGNYYDTIVNFRGCDSMIQLVLNIIQIDTSVAQNGNILISNQGNARYQWLDCSQNYTALPKDTFISFKPTVNGNYAVAVTYNSCTDTSSCHYIGNAGMEEFFSKSFEVFPNPSDGKFTLSFTTPVHQASIKIYNTLGQVVWQGDKVQGSQITIYLNEQISGIYIIKVMESTDESIRKVIIE